MKNVFYTNPKVTDTTRHRRRVWCCSNALAKYFDEKFGRKAWNKHFPEEFVTGPLEIVEGLLRGLWEGDGSVEPRGFQRARLCTVSPRLAEQVGRMLRRLGYMPSVSVRRLRGTGKHLQYHVQLSGARGRDSLVSVMEFNPSLLAMGNRTNNTKQFQANTFRSTIPSIRNVPHAG